MLYQYPDKDIDAKLIKYYIDKSSSRSDTMYKLFQRYKTEKEGTPIKSRVYKINEIIQADKINNKINNDFFSEIVDIKVGFFTGVPMSVMLDKKEYMTETEDDLGKTKTTEKPSDQYDIDNDYIQDFNKYNSIDDINIETAKKAAICGYAGRLIYNDEGSDEFKVVLRDPWNCIFLGDSLDSPKASIYHYCIESFDAKGKPEKTYYAYLYDDVSITEFKREEKDEYYIIGETKEHLFGINPLIGFANNEELQGDAEKVLELIDAYDRTLSDLNNEIEQFRLAYMVAKGCKLDKKVIEDAIKTGAFSLPAPDSSLEFVTKIIDINSILAYLKELKDNIYRFSKTPNMQDEAFAGNASGVAMEFKFRAFEYKCIMAEQKFKKSLRRQYEILSNMWDMQGATINYLDIDYIFTRNYPKNLLEQADIQLKLKGLVSDKTRLSLASFVTDPEKEIEEMGQDTEKAMANAVNSVYANAKATNKATTDNTDKGGVNE